MSWTIRSRGPWAVTQVLSQQGVADNNDIIVKTDLAMIGELRKVLKRLHYPLEVMLVCALAGMQHTH